MAQSNPFRKYIRTFSAGGFWQKLQRFARQAGLKTVYAALLLFYAYRRKETPAWAKNIALGALGYFLAPLDAIPDLTPIIGYTDDIGVLCFGLVTIAGHINEEVRANARQQLARWFGPYDEKELVEVDRQL
jgi:uncharacterized membrane protein YkvA (DUF1232 family)